MKKRGVGRKGQVTAFIIVGIILLISVSAVIYIRGRIVKKEGIELVTAPRVSVEFMPVNNFVRSCINRLTEDGLKLAEERGGYIYQEGLEISYFNPTEGSALEFFPDSGIIVPYWHYMESPNTCTNCRFEAGMPPLCKSTGACIYAGDGSVEEQLERYIKENFRDCMADFNVEQLGYEITELGEIAPRVTIGDRNVVVNLMYPIEVRKDDASAEMNRFMSTIRSEFTELYTIAYELTTYQMENCFIGMHTQNFLSYYMGLEKGELPPLYEQTIGEITPHMWIMDQVKEELEPKIAAAVSSIGLMNTRNFFFPKIDPNDPGYKTIQGMLDQRLFNPFTRYHNADVSLMYIPLFWDIYADIRPREGQKLLPTDIGGSGSGGLAQLVGAAMQIKTYAFFYQYSFPVVVDIQKTDFKNEPHTFRFGLEINVRANNCIGNDTTVGHASSTGGTELCKSVHADRDATITVVEFKDVYGSPTEVPVPDVMVKFFAGSTCLLGATDENGVIEAEYPSVHGGYFTFTKNGYGETFVENAEITDPSTVYMHAYKEFNVSLLHYNLTVNATTDEKVLAGPSDLSVGEKVIVTIEKLDKPSLMSQVVSFEGGTQREYTLFLLPDGDYDITANYFNNQSYEVPAKCAHMCEGTVAPIGTDDSWDPVTRTPISECCGDPCPTDGTKCDCDVMPEWMDPADWLKISEIDLRCCSAASVWIPDEPQNVTIMGGARFNASQPWQLSKGEWKSGGTVVFKVLSLPKADCIIADDCIIDGCIGYSDELDMLEAYYDDFWVDLLPEIK